MQGLIKAQTILSKFADIEEHSRRVSILAGKLASILKYSEPKARSISIAGYMHDLGKTAWPPELHHKHPLEASDWGLVKAHPLLSERMASEIWSNIPLFIKNLIRSHHERLGGGGYPDGLFDLSEETLLLSACDAFDAMTSETAYNQGPLPKDYALKEIAQFAPDNIIKALTEAVDRVGFFNTKTSRAG